MGGWSVNDRCLDHIYSIDARIVPFDGCDWESAHRELR